MLFDPDEHNTTEALAEGHRSRKPRPRRAQRLAGAGDELLTSIRLEAERHPYITADGLVRLPRAGEAQLSTRVLGAMMRTARAGWLDRFHH
jgi:hypothetical protein